MVFKKLNPIFSSTILKNFFYLFLVQGSNFILPLVSIPYLINTIGTEKFGLVSYSQALMYYFIIICDYGFNVSAVREIAINKNNQTKLNQIVSNVIFTKLFLLFISFIFMVALFCFVPKFNEHFKLYLLSFGMVVGQCLFPVWFFQGIEKMKFIAYFNFFSKSLFTLLIFMLIIKNEDYIYVNIFNSLGNIISAILCYFFVKNYFNIELKFEGFESIFSRLKSDWMNFVSNFSINFYINSNIVILGFFVDNITLGNFSIAEKILTASKQLIIIIFYSIYSKVCVLAKESIDLLNIFLKKALVSLASIFSILGLVLYFGSSIIVKIISGNANLESEYYLQILSIVPLIISLNVPAYQRLLAFELKKEYTFALLFGAVINLVCNLAFVSNFGAIGTCISIIITETFVTCSLHLFAINSTKK
ncbi:MAG: flippase [Bacteroidetes bacterium]|nr:MAG: flippase [Bacteroidota bacterium]